MAAPKCGSCKHYSKQSGCALERQSYGLYRNCVLDNHDLHEPAGNYCGEETDMQFPTLAEIMEKNRQHK